MAGTKAGGLKAASTNKRKFGPDFYRIVGAEGGKAGHSGGFATDKVGADGLTGPERASKYGAIGGSISRKRKKGEEHVTVGAGDRQTAESYPSSGE